MADRATMHIEAFKRVNGDRYDYSGFTEENRTVRCRIHGEFRITAANHLAGVQCRQCSNVTRRRKRRRELIPKLKSWLPKDHELIWVSKDARRFAMECANGVTERGTGKPRGEFIICTRCREAERPMKPQQQKPKAPSKPATRERHELLSKNHRASCGGRYRYGEFNESLAHNEFEVICRIHGSFIGGGRSKQKHCPSCRETRFHRHRVQRLVERWNELKQPQLALVSFEYPKAVVKCSLHERTELVWVSNIKPHSLICSLCIGEARRKRARADLLRKFKAAHGDRYDYSQVEYKGADVKVTIICREHGPWEALPGNHYQGSGCWKCFSGVSSKPERDWMAAIGKKLRQKQSPTARVLGRKRGVCEADATFRNVVVEFDGVYWHSREESKEKDEHKNRLLREAGYHVIRLRNLLPPVKGAHCFTVTEEPDDETVTEVAELIRRLQKQPVSRTSTRRSS